ncbi:L-2-amino-thiazoline-4-carboxylic acid hydrolase [Lachnoclostridium sp. Marseille-P6806]|uniref:L-2-amino-thiazoline-4-carboxylic acid hydrolase n=1 Tax=Lachnoclostridium sp. Marseille-P6806 TaxID=2364793 RepID=UPI001031E9B5|nr:L-2-amino-thiazoline-4-carboxylic acid hydrolase [Lachnoclostridium sp. Marseille-P6806]
MLSEKEKQRITKKYQRMMEPACRNALAKRYGADKADFYWHKTKQTYSRILSEAPDIGGAANRMSHNLYQAAWMLALYEVMERKLSEEEINALMHGVMDKHLNLLRKLPGRFLISRKLSRKLFIRRLERYQIKLKPHLHKDWHNTWGMEVYRDTGEGIHFGLRGCPICDYCREHDMMAILPYLCNMDHWLIQAMHLYLIRPTTCSNGDAVCDYMIVADNSPLAGTNPVAEMDNGLLLTKEDRTHVISGIRRRPAK